MAHADWLLICPIKSVLTGQYAFSIRMLDRSNKNVREWFLNCAKPGNKLSATAKDIRLGNSTTKQAIKMEKQAIKMLRFLAKRSFTRPRDSRTKILPVKYFAQRKCHIINYLLTAIARSVQRNIRPRSFVQTSPYGLGLYKKTSVWYFTVQTSRLVNK